MNRFSIKDLENLTGIKAHTIRIWEQRYGILQPKRTPTNIRFYDAADLKTALRISLLNNFGYKISRIHRMTDDDMSALIRKISDVDIRLQARTNELIEAALSMDIVRFESLINNHIERHGIEATIEELLFPFLEIVGSVWMTNKLVPAQEHLTSHVIYRKLAVAIDALPLQPEQTGVMLFLPEGEIHEMSLMYVQYLLRRVGKCPLYIGANTPLSELAAVYHIHRPPVIYTHLTSVAEGWDGPRYLEKLTVMFPEARILVSGALLRRKKYVPGRNMQFLHSLGEVRDTIGAL